MFDGTREFVLFPPSPEIRQIILGQTCTHDSCTPAPTDIRNAPLSRYILAPVDHSLRFLLFIIETDTQGVGDT